MLSTHRLLDGISRLKHYLISSMKTLAQMAAIMINALYRPSLHPLGTVNVTLSGWLRTYQVSSTNADPGTANWPTAVNPVTILITRLSTVANAEDKSSDPHKSTPDFEG